MPVISTQKRTQTVRKFEVGNKVIILEGKYKGHAARVVDYHAAFTHHAYTVQECESNKLLLYYEHEVTRCDT